MADNNDDFVSAWHRFVAAAMQLLSGAPSERFLDPYLPLRDLALTVVESAQLEKELNDKWRELHIQTQVEGGTSAIAHLLLVDLSALPAAVEIVEAEEKSAKEPSQAKGKRLLSLGKEAVDSCRDILKLTPLGGGALKVLGEVLDIFKGE